MFVVVVGIVQAVGFADVVDSLRQAHIVVQGRHGAAAQPGGPVRPPDGNQELDAVSGEELTGLEI